MARPESENPDYSSRNRWLGPTPQILFWHLPGPCPILDHFSNYYRPPSGPAKTLQTLRPIKEIAIAQKEDRIRSDYVILRKEEFQLGGSRPHDLGFSISENTAAFGGGSFIADSCQSCSQNCSLESAQSLAGCCGMLPATSTYHMHQWTQHLQTENQPLKAPNWENANWNSASDLLESPTPIESLFTKSNHHSPDIECSWQSLLSRKQLTPEESLVFKTKLTSAYDQHLLKTSEENQLPVDHFLELKHFLVACETSIKTNTPIKLQAHPAGFSDGNDWWVGPHCGRCFSPMGLNDEGCQQCKKDGGPVPIRKRRIMGWAPYWPLHSIMDQASITRLGPKD